MIQTETVITKIIEDDPLWYRELTRSVVDVEQLKEKVVGDVVISV